MATTASFESEFLDDLESFVQKPLQIEPLEQWDPRETATPERHFILGKTANLSIDTQLYMLRDNYAFQDIESLLHMSLHAVEYAECNEIHPVKEQVWLFGIRWLHRYMKFLAMPGNMRKEFYRRHNDRFLNVLGCLLAYNPNERITFYDALRMWDPRHPILHTSGSSVAMQGRVVAAAASITAVVSQVAPPVVKDGDAYVSDHPSPDLPSESTAAPTIDAHHPAAAVAVSSVVAEGRRRLNLKRYCDSSGRTKTRKAYN
jgi:hypothetical protein